MISRKRSGIWIMLNRTALKGDLEHMRGRGGRGLALKLEWALGTRPTGHYWKLDSPDLPIPILYHATSSYQVIMETKHEALNRLTDQRHTALNLITESIIYVLRWSRGSKGASSLPQPIGINVGVVHKCHVACINDHIT